MRGPIFACALTAWSVPALTCIPPPPVSQLPGESAEAYKLRHKAAALAEDDEMHRQYQIALFEKATRVAIARIESTEPVKLAVGEGRSVVVSPMKALKGDPSGDRVLLADKTLTTCGWAGGGSAPRGAPGDYIILFEGDLFRGGGDKFGLLAREARDPKLLQALFDFGIESQAQRGSKRYNP